MSITVTISHEHMLDLDRKAFRLKEAEALLTKVKETVEGAISAIEGPAKVFYESKTVTATSVGLRRLLADLVAFSPTSKPSKRKGRDDE